MQTITPTSAAERNAFIAAYEANRRRSAFIFGIPEASALYDRPIPLRHPFIFYEGHIPGFSFLTLVRLALGGSSINEEFEPLFQRGIDPESIDDRSAAARPWPSRDDVRAFARRCDDLVLAALRSAQLEDGNNPCLAGSQAVHNIIEHEPMHHETLLYMLHQLPLERKRSLRFEHRDPQRPQYRRAAIPAGVATLGAARGSIPFGWDNEFEAEQISVGAFEIDVDSVTNGDYLTCVEAGAASPAPFWRERAGEWYLLTQFDHIPLPRSWPVYVSHDQAEAYARWKALRLPTEAEYHRAAFGTPDGSEREFPWGSAPPDPSRGNFDFERYDPVAVGSYPAGASAWGVNDLVGNGWEWTGTPFGPLRGFKPMASYPVYSADFFDTKHYVMKGASPVTDRRLVRRSFRNWFRGDYPYMYAKFRCVGG
jgi:gamma-glutamyl hercynylcysteine S-oxide synthase